MFNYNYIQYISCIELKRDYKVLLSRAVVTLSDWELQIMNQNLMLENSGSEAVNKMAGLKFLRGTWNELKMCLSKSSVLLYKLREAITKKKTHGEAQLTKWIKKDLLEESLSKCFWFQRTEGKKATQCVRHALHTIRWFGWLGGALLYLFRVGLLPLK